MITFIESSRKPNLTLKEFIEEYLSLRKKGIDENGKYLQEYIEKRAILVSEIPFKDPKEDSERFKKLRYVMKKTNRVKILSSAIEKINYLDPEECIEAFDILSPKKSNSGERNELLGTIRKDFIIKMIEKNKDIITSSHHACGQLGKFQRCLSYVLEKDISNELFEEVIVERKFPTVEAFKTFYENLLGDKIYPKGTTEKKRAFVVQQYLSSVPDGDFVQQALSFAFKTETSNIMLLRIKKAAEHRKMELRIPAACLNLMASFTENEINLVEEEMNATEKKEEANIDIYPKPIDLDTIFAKAKEIIEREKTTIK